MMQQNALNVMVDPRNAVEPLPEKRDQDPRHRSTIIIPDFSYRNAPWRNRVKWPQKQVTGNAVNQALPEEVRFPFGRERREDALVRS